MDFDYKQYKALTDMLKKAQFVPIGPSMADEDPAAAGAPPPGDPAAAGMPPPPGDPAAGGVPSDAGMPPPGDPDAGGMPPMDPSIMGGMPPVDPAMMGGMSPDMGMPPPEGGDVSPSGEPYMKITPTQLSKLFKQFAEVFKSVLGIQAPAGGQAVAQAPAPAVNQQQDAQLAELNAKLDAIIHG